VLLSPFSSSTIWVRLSLTILFLLLGSGVAVFTLTTVAFNHTVSGLELLAPLVFPGTIIALHLLWKSIAQAGRKVVDPHNQGIK
ncbi:MAG TPA: hypothetical protein VFU05_18620, partial [Cyclobacteriaceae bacterium]|nr:hypothetical protein [Cyclobacteriaceae bacterium]